MIDARAPRFNQATVGLLAVVAVATGWWWLLAALGAQLVVGLTFGRRFGLPCLVYFELVQPRFGEGRLEDSRPPKFANKVGAVILLAAAAAYALDATVVGVALGSLVAALALLRGDRRLRGLRGLQARLVPARPAVCLVPDPGRVGATELSRKNVRTRTMRRLRIAYRLPLSGGP